MKRLLLLLLLLVSVFQGFSQTKGISYQAVILNPNPQELPGVNSENNVLANSAVSIQFTIVNASGTEEYQEVNSTRTDKYGMINLLIGTGSPTSSNDFADIFWDGTTKKLKVGIDFNGGSNFSALSEQNLTFMPQPPTEEVSEDIAANSAAILAEQTRAKQAEQSNADGISTMQAEQTIQNAAITLNTAKVGLTPDQATTITNTTGINTGDQDISGIAINTTAISDEATTARAAELANANGISTLQAEQTTQNTAIASNTAKVSYPGDQDISGIAINATAMALNTTDIAQEILDRAADVAAEESRAIAAEGVLTTAISNETIEARASELANENAITAEELARIAGDDSNVTAIASNTADIAQEILDRVADVAAEEARAGLAEVANANDISAIEAEQTTQNTAIASNTAKVSYPGDQDISGIAINSSTISTIQGEQTSQNDAIDLKQDNVIATIPGQIQIWDGAKWIVSTDKIGIGNNAGSTSQGVDAVAIGTGAGSFRQGTNAVALGIDSGRQDQGEKAVAIGYGAGFDAQGTNSVALGYVAGQLRQGANSIALGYYTGAIEQDVNAIAIGNEAGRIKQGENTVAIGNNAGRSNQRENAVAIGNKAGDSYQPANSIILNASGNSLNSNSKGFYVDPVRTVTASGTNYTLSYNSATKEIFLNDGAQISGTNTGDQNLSTYATKDMANTPITNLATPTNAQDAVTKAYVDTEVSINADLISDNEDDISTNAEDITVLEAEQTLQNIAIASNTLKTGISTQQASEIVDNNVKVSADGSVSTHSDVTVTSVADNEVLSYDSTTSKWINQTAAEAGLSSESHTHASGDIVSGTFADSRIASSNVVQHEGAITIGNLIGAPTGSVVGNSDVQTLTNKSIDADNNTITNIDNTNIKVGAAIDATKVANGSVSNTEFQQLNGVSSSIVGESDTQTLTNKTFTDSSTYIQDNVDNSKKLQFELSGITTSTTRTLTVPDANTTLVGEDTFQTLINKSIDADNNTITNIDNTNIKVGAAIDATKVANGSVSNTEFQQLNGVSSSVVGISDTQTLTNKTLTSPIISTISNTGTLTLPTLTDTMVGRNTSDTFTNKTINSTNNTIIINTSDITDFNTATDGRISLQRGAVNGLASLDGSGKVPTSQLSLSSVAYQGTWNSNTNTPTLSSGSGTKGHYYVLSASGSTSLDGLVDWEVGDWVVFNGTVWEKADHTDAVTSVAGKQGVITLGIADITDLASTADLPEGSNFYYTDARVSANTSVSTNAGDIIALEAEQILQNIAIASNTLKTGITGQQASEIVVNNTKVSADGSVSTHSDVTVTSVTDNEVLTYDSTTSKWINQTSVEAGLASESHTHASGDIVSGTFADSRIASSNVVQHEGSITISNLIGAPTGSVVGNSDVQSLTNKSIDAGNNTITNIDDASIKVGAAIDATKIANGSVSNTEFQRLNGVSSSIVGISDAQTLTNKTFTDISTYIQDNFDNSKKVQFELSGITTSTTRTLTVPDANATLVGTNSAQTLTNKTLTSPIISTISNTGTLTLPTSTDTMVGRSTTDTFTNKSFGDNLNMNGNSIQNLVNPTSDQDAATKNYVDVISGNYVDLTTDQDISGIKNFLSSSNFLGTDVNFLNLGTTFSGDFIDFKNLTTIFNGSAVNFDLGSINFNPGLTDVTFRNIFTSFQGDIVDFRSASTNFEFGSINFNPAVLDVNFRNTLTNFEGADVNFRNTLTNFEFGSINFNPAVFDVNFYNRITRFQGEDVIYYNSGSTIFSNSLTHVAIETNLYLTGSPGSSGDVLTNDGTGLATWQAPSAVTIMQTTDAFALTLSASNSGQIIYSQNTTMPAFPESLPDGYNCVIVNYSNGTYTSNVLSSTKFYSAAIGNGGSTTFSIPPGGTVNVYVVTTGGVKKYFIK